MIPSDIGVRLRTEADALLQPIPAVPEIPSELPELRPGQGFSARIIEALPQNTYKALVAGKTVTLALPEGAKQGDVLDLQVVDRTPRTIVAQLAPASVPDDGTDAAMGAYRYARLSPAGQLISDLLPADGQRASPAALGRGEALVAQPPLRGADLVPGLAKAIAQSGLFYEAHQAQWIAGQLPMHQLLEEPQGRHSNPATLLAHGVLPQAYQAPAALVDTGRTATTNPQPPGMAPQATARQESPVTVLLQALFGGEEPPAQASAPAPAALSVPEDLKPLVQQQLDGAAGQRLAWHGEVWPRQAMDWEIEWPQRGAPDDDTTDRWSTRLGLTTPRLGAIDARLTLTGNALRIAIATPVGATAADLRQDAPALADALAAAGIRLASLQVHHDTD